MQINKPTKKVIAIIVVAVLLVNLVLFGMGLVNVVLFWAIILTSFLIVKWLFN
jgi:hypothetical protein